MGDVVNLHVLHRNGKDRVFRVDSDDADSAVELASELLCSSYNGGNFICVNTVDGMCVLRLDKIAGLRVSVL